MYPAIPRRDGTEGWVHLQFMVDEYGRPYEIAVTDAFGHESFQGAAIRAVAATIFEPARVDGHAVDAGHELKVVFRQPGGRKGASRKFGTKYRKLMRFIEAGRRLEAKEEMAKLEAFRRRNLYEDAFLNIAKYNYYKRWGHPSQQLRALDRAIAYERTNRFLPKDVFVSGLLDQFRLLVETGDYGRALVAHACLTQFQLDQPTALRLKAAVDQIEALKASGQTFRTPGRIAADGSWYFSLLRDEFAVGELAGSIDTVKLRCARSHRVFAFDTGRSYRISGNPGPCRVQLVGEPGTTFALLQM